MRSGRESDDESLTARIDHGVAGGWHALAVLGDAVIKTDVPRVAVVVIHDEKGDRLILGRGCAALAVIVALEGDSVGIAPAGLSAAARELMMEPGEVGHFIVVEFTEVRRIRVARKRGAAIGRRLEIAVGIDEGNAFTEEV